MAVLKTLVNDPPYFLRQKFVPKIELDSNGNPMKGEGAWQSQIPCDVVPAGKANERVFEDGVKRSYSYTIYLDKNCEDFYYGQEIMLQRAGSKEVTYHTVKGFHRYQLQAKLWV